MEDPTRETTWTRDVEWPQGEPIPAFGKPVENLERFNILTEAVAFVDEINSEWERDDRPSKTTVTLRFYLPIL